MATNVAFQATTSPITDKKLYVPVVTLLNQDYAKLFEQLKSVFKKIINWNKYQWKVSPERINQYSDFLINTIFQGNFLIYHLKMKQNEQVTNDSIYLLEK